MTVYVDVLFAVNLLMDYLTLLAAARFGGVQVTRRKLLFAAALGGLYAILATVWPWTALPPFRLAAGVLLCLAAFGRQAAFTRVCALYFVISAAFAGFAVVAGRAAGTRLWTGAGYYFALPLKALLPAAALCCAISGILLRGDAAHGAVQRQVEQIRLCFLNVERTVTVLRDTGNALYEPLSGRPALVLDSAAARPLLGSYHAVLDGLTTDNAAECLRTLPPALSPRFGLLPFHAVGTAGGLLLYFRPDGAWRANGTAMDCVVAISPERLTQKGYEGLLGV